MIIEEDYMELHIENPILVGALAKYRTFLEEAGFSFSEEVGGLPTVMDYPNSEGGFQAPEKMCFVADDLRDYLEQCWVFADLGPEEFKELSRYLFEQIHEQSDEINRSYRALRIVSVEHIGDVLSYRTLTFDGNEESFAEETEEL